MTCEIATGKATAARRCRILLTCAVCAALVPGGAFRSTTLRAQTLQQQQQRERQQELEREREEQQRQREQEQERQREQQREQEQERQRDQQQEREQEQQRQREQQEREREQEQQRQQQQQREREQEQQRQREAVQRQMEAQREQQQRTQTQRPAPQRSVPEPRDPVLQTRPVNPEHIRPVRMPEAPVVNAPRPVESRPVVPHPIVPERQVNSIEPPPRPDLPERHPEPVRGEISFRPELPHPILPRPVVVPEHRPEPVHLDPRRRDGRPVVVERPRVFVARPSTEVILALPAPRRTVVVAPQPGEMYVASTPAQNYAAAQARLQAAQASCAQADAYQNYVNSVISNQNNMSQGMDQVLQTIADNTSDPDTQSALLGAIGQPNPINDALEQQLTAQANTYEGLCQSRLATAQAAMPPDPSQTGVAVAAGGQVIAGGVEVQSGVVQQAPQAVGAAAYLGDLNAQAQPASQACTSGVTRALPAAQGRWGPWVPLGNSGLVFSESHVDAKNLTWRFMNAGSQTITSMDFTYTYVDADTGQTTTSPDQLPYALKPGQSVGGWAAYLANTRGDVSIQLTDIACK